MTEQTPTRDGIIERTNVIICNRVSAGDVSWSKSEAAITVEKTQEILDRFGAGVRLRLYDGRNGIEGYMDICGERDQTTISKEEQLLEAARQAERVMQAAGWDEIPMPGHSHPQHPTAYAAWRQLIAALAQYEPEEPDEPES